MWVLGDVCLTTYYLKVHGIGSPRISYLCFRITPEPLTGTGTETQDVEEGEGGEGGRGVKLVPAYPWGVSVVR